MKNTLRVLGLLIGFLFLCLGAVPLWAFDEIQIREIRVEAKAADRCVLHAQVQNGSEESREVTLRGQIAFYEKASPRGDKPAMILRQDRTLVLKPEETRALSFDLIHEGMWPQTSLRLEPSVRIRRNRPWSY